MLTINNPDDLARHQQLCALIRTLIVEQGGRIPFSQYMHSALYTPGLGFYSADHSPVGKTGHFITAPEISDHFGRCLAKQCQQVLSALEGGDILEFGAGNGTLAAQLLVALEAENCLPRHYYILEVSATLRAEQQQTLRTQCPALAARVHWLDRLPEPGFKGLILANEVLDAMPVALIIKSAQGLEQAAVSLEDDHFVWSQMPLDFTPPSEFEHLNPPYITEYNLYAHDWIASLSAILSAGAVFLIDYGFTRAEYYHPDRAQGTLMCHYQHHSHSDPLILTGLQDITAHVDFSLIAEAAKQHGFAVTGFAPQAWFLLSLGITDFARDLNETAAIKRLTAPQEMGELFKVIALCKDLPSDLQHNLLGFQLQNSVGKL
jgi:SAM-dependent MidA family methyltransferase